MSVISVPATPFFPASNTRSPSMGDRFEQDRGTQLLSRSPLFNVQESVNSLIAKFTNTSTDPQGWDVFWDWSDKNDVAGSIVVTPVDSITPFVELPDNPIVEAVEQIKSLLTLTDSQVAKILNVSRRTLSNWRNGQSSYDSTTRRLRALRTLTSHLRLEMGGDEELRLWFEMDSGLGITRLEALCGGDEGYFLVLAQAEPFLFRSTSETDTYDSPVTEHEIVDSISEMSSGPSDYVPRTARRVRKR